jgi:hypothetical protein
MFGNRNPTDWQFGATEIDTQYSHGHSEYFANGTVTLSAIRDIVQGTTLHPAYITAP